MADSELDGSRRWGGVWKNKETGELVLTLGHELVGLNDDLHIRWVDCLGLQWTLPRFPPGTSGETFLDRFEFVGVALDMVHLKPDDPRLLGGIWQRRDDGEKVLSLGIKRQTVGYQDYRGNVWWTISTQEFYQTYEFVGMTLDLIAVAASS